MLDEVQNLVEQESMYAAGFLAYEAGPAFDPALCSHPVRDFPLAWFGIFPDPEPIQKLPASTEPPHPPVWNPDITTDEYHQAIRQIKRYIATGDTYQVNFTIRLHASLTGDPWDLFLAMIQAQGNHYGAYIQTDKWSICSASPELFFELDGNVLISRPMKGTSRRGLWSVDDQNRARRLKHSVKNRAENVMIVDMVRNDLGRIAQTGSVQVPRLFEVEQYPTVWQMTSTVQAQTNRRLPEVLQALFPPASITGAPKVRTTQIIAELEKSPRRIYTGAIGYTSPNGRAQFNVAIRTVLVDHQSKVAEYGVGGGIVWGSTGLSEYEECQIKARVLTHHQPDFSLIESLRWTPEEGYAWLQQHINRLVNSGRYFGWQFDRRSIQHRLDEYAHSLSQAPHKVRLVISKDGSATIETQVLIALPDPYTICLAERPVNTQDQFLYHKTTHRQVYEQAMSGAPGCNDALLWNERGEITESCIANVLIELDGELFTPSLRCGLLPGIYRSWLLKRGNARERIITIADLANASKIFLANSVRGMWQAVLEPGQSINPVK